VLALRVISPPGTTGALLDCLREQPGATHVVLLPGAALEPTGDLLMADLAREAVTDVVDALRAVPGGDACAYALADVTTTLSAAADRAEQAAPGRGVDAVVWEEVEQRTSEEAELSASFLLLLVLATLLAAVGLMLDSAVLIVGAMVVGPEYGPVAGLTVAAVTRRWDLARRSLSALAVGFPLAVVAAGVLGLLVQATAGFPAAYAGEQRPLTAFVSRPDGYALLVALLAGVAGVVSLTSAKSSALVGVAVSVTTVPAAADVGVAASAARWGECLGALGQLVLNLVALVVAGAVTLSLRRVHPHVTADRSARPAG
jgi:uncharacterized hydrophobic protein (TIGR00271 family)